MHRGRAIFAQLIGLLPNREFRRCVDRYNGNRRGRGFPRLGMQRERNVGVLRKTGGVISSAAARLGVPRTTLNAMMRKLGISRQDL
jgi:transcriptional regulator of acetoin/glycerol metabolism